MRLSGRDHRRRDEAAGEADQPDERPMPQRQADGDERDRHQDHECQGGLHKVVERDRREQAGIERGDARRRQRLPDGGGLAPHEIAADQQRDAQHNPEHDPHARAQQALVDRIFDQEEAGQRDAGAARATRTRARPAAVRAHAAIARRRGAAVPTSRPAQARPRAQALARLAGPARPPSAAPAQAPVPAGRPAWQAAASPRPDATGDAAGRPRPRDDRANPSIRGAGARPVVPGAGSRGRRRWRAPAPRRRRRPPPANRISPHSGPTKSSARRPTIASDSPPRRRRPAASWRGVGAHATARDDVQALPGRPLCCPIRYLLLPLAVPAAGATGRFSCCATRVGSARPAGMLTPGSSL